MTIAPVMLFTYSRPEHTRSTLEALCKNDLVEETCVYAYTCGPKNPNHSSAVDSTKNVLLEFKDNNPFLKFIIVDLGDHVPLGPAMVTAVDNVMSEHGKVIVVEDDIVTSKDFLRFMNDCLDYYQNDSSVFSISGYSPNSIEIAGLDKDVYVVHRACPWGWGTWSNRWRLYDPDVKGYVNNMFDRKFRRSITKWNTDLPMTLDALFFEGGCKDKNWEQQFCFCQFLNGMNTVCPKNSKVKNIGFDGTGTNPIPTGLGSSFYEDGSGWELEPLTLDSSFQKAYNKRFIFRPRTKLLIKLSNMVHFISPRLYYRLLNVYYHTSINVEDLQNNE